MSYFFAKKGKFVHLILRETTIRKMTHAAGNYRYMDHDVKGKPWVAYTSSKVSSRSVFCYGVQATIENNSSNNNTITTIAITITINLNLNLRQST